MPVVFTSLLSAILIPVMVNLNVTIPPLLLIETDLMSGPPLALPAGPGHTSAAIRLDALAASASATPTTARDTAVGADDRSARFRFTSVTLSSRLLTAAQLGTADVGALHSPPWPSARTCHR